MEIRQRGAGAGSSKATESQRAPLQCSAKAGGEDLSSRGRIHDVVVDFYREVVFDDVLAPVFEEVAEVDWARHIPLLIDYWCRVLLGHDGYQGALLAAHRHVHEQEALRAEHFDRWYTLWVGAVDARSSGPTADTAKRHAAKIATTLANRLSSLEWTPPDIGTVAMNPARVSRSVEVRTAARYSAEAAAANDGPGQPAVSEVGPHAPESAV
jgi:hemoglobin